MNQCHRGPWQAKTNTKDSDRCSRIDELSKAWNFEGERRLRGGRLVSWFANKGIGAEVLRGILFDVLYRRRFRSLTSDNMER